MASIIQIRRDTSANWTSANPVLAQGELGAEIDTHKIKMGDGSTAWNSLGYLIDTGDYLTTSNIGSTIQAYDSDLTTWAGKTAPSGTVLGTDSIGVSVQANLVSGTNIKTVGGNTIIGTGDVGTITITYGGTNATSFTGKSANVAGLIYYDGSKLTNDSTVTDVGYDTANNTVMARNISISGHVTENVYTLSSTTPVLSPANGTIQIWTLTGSSTPTESLTSGQSMILGIDDGTEYTITWPTITWATTTATAPTLATSGYTWVVLWKVDTTLYGKY